MGRKEKRGDTALAFFKRCGISTGLDFCEDSKFNQSRACASTEPASSLAAGQWSSRREGAVVQGPTAPGIADQRGRGGFTEGGGGSASAGAGHQGAGRGHDGAATQHRGRGQFRGTPGGRRPGGQRGRPFNRQPRRDAPAWFRDFERNLHTEPVSARSRNDDRGSRDGGDSNRASRPSWEEDVRPSFPIRADRRPADRAVPFPSFDDVTAAGKCRRDDIGPASGNAASRYVYDCFLNALSSGAKVTLSSFRLVPDAGLGRLVEAVNCNLASLYGKAVAFCDPDKEYICYGKVLKLGKEQVALLYDGAGVTSENESHEFVLVNLNVDAFCFIHFLAAIKGKSSDDLSRVESLFLMEGRQRLDADPIDISRCGTGSSINTQRDGKVSLDDSQAAALQAVVTSDRGVLIHAPSGTGGKELLNAAVHSLLNMGHTMEGCGPVVVANHKSAKVTKNKAENMFDLDAEVDITFEGSASAVVSQGKLNECLVRLSEVLQEICTMKSAILHQSHLEGVTREFSMKRHEERNFVEPWLFFGINHNEMKAAVSRADIEAFRKDCQNVLKAFVYAFGELRNADESCHNVFNIVSEKNQRTRPALSLTCARHPRNIIRVESGSSFRAKFQPNGACMNPCEAKKLCGHRCMQRCHDGDHPAYCDQPCLRKVCKRNHLCRNRCSERCTDRCLEVFTAKLPNCDHDASFRCYMWDGPEDMPHTFTAGPHEGSAVQQFKCRKTVTVDRRCGHSAQVLCFEKQAMAASTEPELERLGPCQETIQVKLACGHTASTVCCKAAGYRCSVPVVLVRPCGHSYSVPCGAADRRLVPPCNVLVRVALSCGHFAQRVCHRSAVPLCTTLVRRILPCGHAADVSCGDIQTPPCLVTVSKTLSCGHVQIRPCFDTRSPCIKSCGYMLPCRHPCNLRCGNHPHPERCEACRISVLFLN
ncbi:hypothetical protein HPB48_005336 [Haemaphysalis longicornis]|uniref:NF-X1-type domain-containing protein n=1 Tax=Haemaphysalis longicornis TaxID=44386 RepID=A0A9J6GFT3_HAELO|nr:hypothetical protein HPB48_005336 [Haemaphysalis longicornis]